MRGWVLTFLLCYMVVSGARAQGENPYTITVIQDDGTKAVVDIGKKPAEQPQNKAPPEPESEPEQQQAAPERPDAPTIPEKSQAAEKPQKPQTKKASAPPVSRPRPAQADRPKTVKPSPKPAPEEREVLAPGQYISPERAFAIASEEAPPAMGFEPYKALVDGDNPGYGFIFKTDEGPYKVVVDARDGVIVISRPVNDTYATPKPGHLPVR